MTVFSGVMIRIKNISNIGNWIFDVSVLKHSLQGILHAVYGYDEANFPCTRVSLFLFSNVLKNSKILINIDK